MASPDADAAVFVVWLKSDPHGAEDFRYGSLEEALEGVGRVARAAFQGWVEDGVEREVVLECWPQADGAEEEGD